MSKKALLVGINYTGTGSQLNGCINDVLGMKNFLTTKGFSSDSIVLLTDETSQKPTRENILQYFSTGINQMNPGDTFYFHYSGHGSSVPDDNGDESDNQDEVMVPLDYDTNGFIIDDTLRAMVDRAPEKSRVILVIDACHSETFFDLRYLYDPVTRKQLERTGIRKKLVGGKFVKSDQVLMKNAKYAETKAEVIVFSGCKDNQTSADAFVKGKYNGALTASFLDILQKGGGNVSISVLPIKSRDFIMTNKLGSQIPRITFGRADFSLDKDLF